MVDNSPYSYTNAGGDHFIRDDSLVSRGGPIKRVDADDLEFHVFLFAAYEINAAIFPLEPLAKVDAGTVLDIENFATLAGILT